MHQTLCEEFCLFEPGSVALDRVEAIDPDRYSCDKNSIRISYMSDTPFDTRCRKFRIHN